MEKQEVIKATGLSQAIKLLENLKGNPQVSNARTVDIDSTLGALGRVFKDLDPKEDLGIKIGIEVTFKPFKVKLFAEF